MVADCAGYEEVMMGGMGAGYAGCRRRGEGRG
jgi:hypothetical protein